MKRFLLVVAALVIITDTFAVNNFKLSGNIQHPLADSIKFLFAPTSAIYKPVELATKINNDGSFSIAFEVPAYYTKLTITHGNQQTEIFMQPGMDLNMQLDASNFDSSLKYTGKGQEIANFMAKHVLIKNGMLGFNMAMQTLYIKEADEFEKAVKEQLEAEMDFLKKHETELPVAFKEYYEVYYRYMMYGAIDLYPPFHEMRKQNSMSVKNIPAENYVVASHVPAAFDDKYIDMETYQHYLTNFFSIQMDRKRKADSTAVQKPSAELYVSMAYKQMPPKTAQFYAAHIICQFSKSTSYSEVAKLCDEYKTRYPQSPYLPELDKVLANKKIIASGNKAIDFNIVTPEGKTMKLSDLKGQVVYIDFWSRGCAPCLAEMPEAKKVREYFKQKPVAFVYISLDADDNEWKKAIKEFKVEGINMHVDKDWQSEVVQKYDVKGIPSYFLVDKKGKFASVEDIARPSDSKKLIAQIEALLK